MALLGPNQSFGDEEVGKKMPHRVTKAIAVSQAIKYFVISIEVPQLI